MIVLLDTATPFDECERDLGGVVVEQLLTPLTRYRLQRPDAPFAVDNGSFSEFDGPAFEALLRRELHRRAQCRWVAAPDVVGQACRTLELFDHWHPILNGGGDGWPVAMVAQDGQENQRIPWDRMAAVFIGGSTEWKLGKHAQAIVRVAKQLGKWVHAGRVNTPGRFEYFEEMGADSIDGTGLSRYTWMRKRIAESASQMRLFGKGDR